MSNTLNWVVWSVLGLPLLVGYPASACQEKQTDENATAEKAADDPKSDREGATIRGKITPAEASPFEFDVTTLPVTISEQITYTPLPLPPDWGTRTEEQRQQWIKEFQESDAGKEFLANREERQKNQRSFPLEFEKDGSFEVYDVPPGNYNMFGRKDVEADGKKYAVEVFGQIEVVDVDELELKPLPIDITRLLTSGEAAPEFSVDSLQAEGTKITLSQFRGRPVLVCFWSMSNPDVQDGLTGLKSVYDALSTELKLELLAICVDENVEKAAELIAVLQLTWPQGRTGGWKHPIIADYGVRAFPANFLVGADGKLLLTEAELFREFVKDSSRDLTMVIRDKVTGSMKSNEK